MATADDILNLARSQIGVCEQGGNNRGTPYHAWFGAHSQGWQWCAIFVDWVFHHTDPALIRGLKSAYSGTFLEEGRKYREEVSIAQALPGDLVIYDYGDGGITDHIGIIEERLGPTTFRTIEGNVNNRVGRRERTAGPHCRMWFVRPAYTQPEVEEEEEEMGMMFIPPQSMPKQGDKFVWNFVEGFNEMPGLSEIQCWLLLYNEDNEPAEVEIYTAPSTGIIKQKLQGWERQALPFHQVTKDRGVTGGFTTVIKSKSPNIVSGISIYGR